jgi:hypothetical protein
MTGQAPEARVVQEIVPADKLAEALERIYFDGNYVLSTVPAGIYVDERAMRASASLGAVMTFTEFRVIYIKGKFL